uniref:No apical meristem-associated C-terminal domain-containing protein n=1 Tax=Globisporangium ultimum (strain ATCC 200006 / CBS 805.95 / DAOM BR144) TaxID=431595 RepID=K3WIW7_GLOUD
MARRASSPNGTSNEPHDEDGGASVVAAAAALPAALPIATTAEEQQEASPVGCGGTASASTLCIEDADLLRKRRKFTHTTEAQRLCMLEWLEQPQNFQLMTERASAVVLTNAAGKKLKKADGYRSLMRHVNQHAHAQWTLDVTRSRYESFIASFKKAQKMAAQSVLTVTANDRVRGITEVAQKLNAMCLFYDRIEALFATGKPLADGSGGVAEKGAENQIEKNGNEGQQDNDNANAGGAGSDEEQHEKSGDATSKADATKGEEIDTVEAPRQQHVDAVSEAANDRKRTRGRGGAEKKPTQQPSSEEGGSISDAEEESSSSVSQDDDDDAELVAPLESQATLVNPRSSDANTSSCRRKKHKFRDAKQSGDLVLQTRGSTRRLSGNDFLAAAAASAVATANGQGVPADSRALPPMSDEMAAQFIAMEREKLALQQEHMRMQKRELELKEKELAAQEETKKHAIRADLMSKLAQAGKTPGEIKEYLLLLG